MREVGKDPHTSRLLTHCLDNGLMVKEALNPYSPMLGELKKSLSFQTPGEGHCVAPLLWDREAFVVQMGEPGPVAQLAKPSEPWPL